MFVSRVLVMLPSLPPSFPQATLCAGYSILIASYNLFPIPSAFFILGSSILNLHYCGDILAVRILKLPLHL